MERIRAFFRALLKRRHVTALERFEAKLSCFTPSDWFIVGVIGIVMALAAGVLLAGTSLALTSEVPARGGTYVEGIVGTPRFVNPLLAISDADRDLSALVYSGLMKHEQSGALVPDLAEKYAVSDDGRTYTFTLRNDARFSDGTGVTADDVAFTVRMAENPDVKSPVRANWAGVSPTVVDEKTIAFTLQTPYAPFLENATLGILPKRLWEGVTAEQFPFTTLNQEPVGSGPYRVEDVVRNSSGIPTEYDLAANTAAARVPYITDFVLKFYADRDALSAALGGGAVEAAYGIAPSAALGDAEHETFFDRVFAVFFDQNQNRIFADPAVRAALDAAVDKNAIVSTVLSGYGSVADGPLPPRSVGENGSARSKEERIGRARSVLEGAGWKRGADGVYAKTLVVNRKKTTERLAFSLSTSNVPELEETARLAAADWNAMGAEVAVQFFDQSDLALDVIRPRKYDALLFGLVVGREYDLYPFWHSSQKNDPGLNVALYANTAVDKELEAARAATDLAARRTKAEEAANTISAEHAAVFLYAPYFVYLAPRAAQGITLGTVDTPSDRFADVEDWYLSTERIWPIFATDPISEIKKLLHYP